ncbi:MAG: tetratricopeptide (TPR) repeat protein [Paraglaciecola sp.]|jgi:tetratricopeptide (TPR) repeat protein
MVYKEMTLKNDTAASKVTADFHQLLQQGLSFLNNGKLQDAQKSVTSALIFFPKSTQANFLLGLTEYSLGNHEPALTAFKRVLEHDPNNCMAWAHTAELYVITGDIQQAESALAQAISHQDGSANFQQMIGIVKSLLNEHEAALNWYKKATQQQPNNVGFLLNQATCLMYLGDVDDAEKMLKSILNIQPFFANAHWLLSGLKKAHNDNHINEMQHLLSQRPFSPIDVAYLQYACGKECEDLALWPQAFDAFAKASSAKRQTIQFDEPAEIEMYQQLEQSFTEIWMEQGNQGYDDYSPIFVLGEPRSGTTLVERIIGAHSMVHSAGELRNFVNCISQLQGFSGSNSLSSRLVDGALTIDPRALGETYMSSVAKLRGNTPHFVDKLPTNYLVLPLILKALPKAKIIHLRRDPMDTCFSGFKQLFTQAYPYSYEQQEIARHHARYLKLMSKWRERFGQQYFEVQYEEVASDFELNARRLVEFLGLPWEDACLQFHQQKSAVTTASSIQVRQPAHTGSIARWKKYEVQLQPMLAELKKHSSND